MAGVLWSMRPVLRPIVPAVTAGAQVAAVDSRAAAGIDNSPRICLLYKKTPEHTAPAFFIAHLQIPASGKPVHRFEVAQPDVELIAGVAHQLAPPD